MFIPIPFPKTQPPLNTPSHPLQNFVLNKTLKYIINSKL